jgi:hypothetical protein
LWTTSHASWDRVEKSRRSELGGTDVGRDVCASHAGFGRKSLAESQEINNQAIICVLENYFVGTKRSPVNPIY